MVSVRQTLLYKEGGARIEDELKNVEDMVLFRWKMK